MKIRKLIVLVMLIMFIISVCNFVFAADSATASIIKNKFNGDSSSNMTNSSVNITAAILNIVRIIGAGIAIIMLTVVAAKYMMASAGDRADIKKYAINYVIGAIILFGATGILTMIREFVLNATE